MAVVRGSAEYTGSGAVVTIGNFDGVHLGHRALLDAARSIAGPRSSGVCAYTFHPAPRDVLRPDNGILRIQDLDDRVRALHEAGADDVLVEPFDLTFAARTPDWFAEEVLTRRLRASAVVVGWDFRFGRGRSGTAEGLRTLLDVPVHQVQAVELEGQVISSSRIREHLTAGDVQGAARLLGRPHEVVGTVVQGDARGRELGFPTANLDSRTPLVPANGVYAARLHTGEGAVVNVGTRPTFGGGATTVEVHVLDFAGDLYGAELHVGFVERLRGEQAFPGRDALVAQIARDVERARALLAE
ncbi:MAG: bifunctional riboflavin kinase/FAD synthetase [Myxococcota bacterium]